MEYSTLFARHFARLVWLLLHEPSNINEQKSALRAMVALSKFGAIRVESRDWQIVTNDEVLPDATSGVMELVAQMAVHGIRAIRFAIAPVAAHVLGVARFLATRPIEGDPGRLALEHLRTIGATSVTLVLDDAIVTVSAHANGAGSLGGRGHELAEMDVSHDLTDETTEPIPAPPAEEKAVARPKDSEARQPKPAAKGTGEQPLRPSQPTSIPPVVPQGLVPEENGGGMWMNFTAAQAPSASVDELFARLGRFQRPDAVTRVLDDLVLSAENAAREGKGWLVADVFRGIVSREAGSTDELIRRAYSMAIRRMSRPALLRAVAHLLPRKRDAHNEYVAVLVRTGEDGADALIDLLTQAQKAEERRVYFDVLLQLQAGVPALIHMLGDARWFVARNAAELLGEMKAADAEEPLKQLLKHHDDRVRRAAANALINLESSSARQAVHAMTKDASPQVRMQVAAALSTQRDGKTGGTLTRALDDEVDPEVQLAIIAALGKVATTEAVSRLIKAAEPDGRVFFKKKTTAQRVAAVQALAEARTPAAMTALWQLFEDKDREVRDMVQRLVGPLKAR